MIQFLATNWLWIGLVVFFVVMHRGGHGCGMHGHHQHQSPDTDTEHAHHSGGTRSTS